MFVGTLVPDAPAYRNPALSAAGNRVQAGFVAGLRQAGVDLDRIVSCRPVPSFPATRRLWVAGERHPWSEGGDIEILPTLNLRAAKYLLWGLLLPVRVIAWSLRRRGRPRVLLCCNLATPPGLFTYLAARVTGTRLVCILYDVGQLACVYRRLAYRLWGRIQEATHAALIRRLDGRIVITEAVAADYAPGRHYLLVDGGVEGAPEPDSAAAARRDDDDVVFLFAGTLWETNGISLMLAAMRLLPDPRIRLRIAGDGGLRGEVLAAAAADPRISYLGRLAPDALAVAYRQADALLNVRLTSGEHASPYLFPSKLLEYLATGKVVVSTAVAHARRDYGAICRFLDAATPESLAAVMAAVAATPAEARRREGAAARAFMLAHRTWDVQGARVVRYIEEQVLGQGRNRETR
jgi:glycosyltransferase involved in cell wall biosynthesis